MDAKHSHENRVLEAFEALHRKIGDKLDDKARTEIASVREAAAAKDGERLRKHLNELSRHHSWLYRELAAHPEVASLLDELALLGL